MRFIDKYVRHYLLMVVFTVVYSSAFGQNYIPPSIENPNNATIEWQTDGSVIVRGGPVTFTSGITHAPISNTRDNQIDADKMVIVDETAYSVAEEDSGLDYGMTLDRLDSDETPNAKVEVYRRPRTGTENPDVIDNNFGFIYDDGYFVYGTEVVDADGTTVTENNRLMFSYKSSGWRPFHQAKVRSNDYQKLWNRPTDVAWWWTPVDYIGAVVIVIALVFASIEIAGGTFLASLGAALGISTFKVLELSALALLLSIGLATVVSFELSTAEGITEPGNIRGIYPQTKFHTYPEIIIPPRVPEDFEGAKEYNKQVDNLNRGAFECTIDPSQQCARLPFTAVVVKVEVTDAHLRLVNIPGALFKENTPYQLFNDFYYRSGRPGTIEVVGNDLMKTEKIDKFGDLISLPNTIVEPFSGTTQTVSLRFTNFQELPYFFLVSKEEPLNYGSQYFINLGIYGEFGGATYNLYRYRALLPEDGDPIVTIEISPDGPFLAGDNLTLASEGIEVLVLNPQEETKSFNVFPIGQEASVFNNIDAKMGDYVQFRIPSPAGEEAPELLGVPSTWTAKFGEEVMFYCTPNTTPGEWKAWLGFDTWVHTLWVRDYVQENGINWQPKEEPWVQEGDYKVWTWRAQRRMDPSKTEYTPAHTWSKTRVINDSQEGVAGNIQRANQKEGTLMDIFQNWPDWQAASGNFQTYTGPKFAHGFDNDEIVYLGGKELNTIENPPTAGLFKFPGSNDPWKTIAEGEGNPIQDVVTAYRKNRAFYKDGNATYSKRYDGYEIQDVGTTEEIPNGTGTGNNEAPGWISIKRAGDASPTRFPIEVKSPLESGDNPDPGFNHIIQGNDWPSVETKQTYTIPNIPLNERDNFVLVYQFSDGFHQERNPENTTVSSQVILSRDRNESSTFNEAGEWEATIDFGKWGYNHLTLYYAPDLLSDVDDNDSFLRYNQSNWTMVAGKELFYMQLMYMSNWGTPLNEARADRQNLIADELRDPGYGYPYTRAAQWNKLASKHFTRYTFQRDDAALNNFELTVYDVDPHTIRTKGKDWYQPFRKIAKSPTVAHMEEKLRYYIAECPTRDCDNVGGGTEVTTGKVNNTWTYDWSQKEPGTYVVRVQYDGGSELSLLLEIVDYQNSRKGDIVRRNLTDQERSWLDLPEPTGDISYQVASVESLLSTYSNITGPRVDPSAPANNRFGEDNDFAYDYTWHSKTTGSDDQSWTVMNQLPQASTFVNEFSVNDWFPEIWVRHIFVNHYKNNGHQGLPLDIDLSLLKEDINDPAFVTYLNGIIGTEANNGKEHKQIDIPWIIVSEMDGKRLRNPPKPIFNLEAIWDNETGAFSGTPSCDNAGCDNYYSDPNDPSRNDTAPTDEQKDQFAFYKKLNSGKIIVFDASQVGAIDLRVTNEFKADDTFDQKFIHETAVPATVEYTYNVAPGAKHQVMDAFGASDAWTTNDPNVIWTPAELESLQKMLFSREVILDNPIGIGLSGWRFNIGSGSRELGTVSGFEKVERRTESFASLDVSGEVVYDWTKQAGSQKWLEAAHDYDVHHLTAFANSHPAFLSDPAEPGITSGNYPTAGNENLPFGKVSNYTSFLADVIGHFKTAGINGKSIDFDFVSPVNEPQNRWKPEIGTFGALDPEGQDGNSMSNRHINRIVEGMEAIQTRFGNTKILVAEAAKYAALIDDYDQGWNFATNGNEVANDSRDQIDKLYTPSDISENALVAPIVTAHGYYSYVFDNGDENPREAESMDNAIEIRRAMKTKIEQLNQASSKEWKFAQTEFAFYGPNGNGKDVGMATALQMARAIHLDLTEANASSWYWWLALSPYDYKDGLINYESGGMFNSNVITPTKTMYALGHYSRFVRPNMHRVDVTSEENVSAVRAATPNQHGLMISAYHDETGEHGTSVVAVNISDNKKSIKLNIDGVAATDPLYVYTTDATSNLSYSGAITLESIHAIPKETIVTFTTQKLASQTTNTRVVEGGERDFALDTVKLEPVIYPNPASDYTHVRFDVQYADKVNIEIVDLDGRTVFSKMHKIASGKQDIEVYTALLSNGIYVLKGTGAGIYFAEQLIIRQE